MEVATIEDEARALIRRGLPIVICDGKVPLGGDSWHTKPVTEANLTALVRQATTPAIGLKMGEYIDIEADGPEEEALVAKLFDGCEIPITPTYQSKRGKHRIFNGDERFRGTNRAVVNFSNGSGAKLGIRIGADGKAAQSVIPPSAGREWLVSWDEVEPAALPDVVVRRILAAAKPDKSEPHAARVNNDDGEVDEHVLSLMRRIKAKPGETDSSRRLIALACRCVEHDQSDKAAIATIRAYDHEQPMASNWSDADIIRRLRDAERMTERGSAPKVMFRNTTDLGNAERFAEQHGADVRHVHVWNKSFVYDGRRWPQDTSGEVMRRAKRTTRSIWAEAARAPKKEMRKRLADWAAASEKRDRLNAMIALSMSEQPIPIAVEQLDSDPYLLNVENGTINLRTGELQKHRRDDYLTKLCPVEYPTDCIDPDLWLSFLDRIFASNAPLIRFVQQILGLSLIGEVCEHMLPIFWGKGANGKTVLIETIYEMLGNEYAHKAPGNLLMATKTDRHPTEIASLWGKRFVAAVESDEHSRLSEPLVKEITGGDSLTARRMREDFWSFKPSHTIILATNHKPVVRGTDHGIWRRIRLVPFAVTIPDQEQDKQLASKLRDEWPAILRWCVAGCLDWQQSGLQAPDEVKAATTTYQCDNDVLGEFLSDRCCIVEASEARASDLYRAYKQWAENRGEHGDTQTRFGLRLVERGFAKGRDSGNRVIYRGIGLAPEGSG